MARWLTMKYIDSHMSHCYNSQLPKVQAVVKAAWLVVAYTQDGTHKASRGRRYSGDKDEIWAVLEQEQRE
uniref:Uncharacterized protein n=1 Tax=Magallana gigas TaxID=29159 RepID=K1R4C6_MAGGI